MSEQWIPEPEWRWIQQTVPISCVDILPLRFASADRRLNGVGLILRETPHQGRRWCLVGGRVRYGESLGDALRRHLVDTLGEDIEFSVEHDEQPAFVAQYRPFDGEDFLVDPRRHAVALTYRFEVAGHLEGRNEALSFKWFDPAALPPPDSFGFGQDRVVAACLATMTY